MVIFAKIIFCRLIANATLKKQTHKPTEDEIAKNGLILQLKRAIFSNKKVAAIRLFFGLN